MFQTRLLNVVLSANFGAFFVAKALQICLEARAELGVEMPEATDEGFGISVVVSSNFAVRATHGNLLLLQTFD